MSKIIISAAILLVLAGCTEHTKSEVYMCEGLQIATITSHSDEIAELNYNHIEYQLVRKNSASGVKYSNENVLFWTKGNEAMLIINGHKQHCNQQ
jgi:membrane-bound inhibitor of C-type lysozyme